MDEKTEDLIRSMAAAITAQDFILNYVLTQLFLEFPKPKRLELAKTMLDLSERSEKFHGVSKDDFQAERLADMVVQTRQKIDQMIGRALAGSEMAEGSQWPPKPKSDHGLSS